MRTRALLVQTRHTPQTLAAAVRGAGGVLLLESAGPWAAPGQRSYVAAEPMRVFRAHGSRCEVTGSDAWSAVSYGNPWRLLEAWLGRFDLAGETDLPFPTGFCAGYWGYELRTFVEPRLRPHPVTDLPYPDCWLGFYDSLVVFEHAQPGTAWIVSTGLEPDGSRSVERRDARLEFWRQHLESAPTPAAPAVSPLPCPTPPQTEPDAEFAARVRTAQRYIRLGHIYQVNLARRWTIPAALDAWTLYRALSRRSPAPFAAYLETDAGAVVSSSPELFLHLDGVAIRTCPIKGTRPRAADAETDARLARELWTSAKERAELTMITDLLRNDLGRVCSFGSVRVPELMRLERFSHVQHLVSTVEGRLRAGVTHLAALEACFPGGSITGAPKFRALQLIDELEPVGRGPYTGALGYLGFNRQSRLSLIIRAAFCTPAVTWYYAGAGIVADSDPAAESAETRAKARGFLDCLDNRGAEIQTLNRDDETGRGAKDAEKDAEKDAHVGVRERRVGTRG
jgi:para-aminobenzoate synthetase component 1